MIGRTKYFRSGYTVTFSERNRLCHLQIILSFSWVSPVVSILWSMRLNVVALESDSIWSIEDMLPQPCPVIFIFYTEVFGSALYLWKEEVGGIASPSLPCSSRSSSEQLLLQLPHWPPVALQGREENSTASLPASLLGCGSPRESRVRVWLTVWM